VGGGRAVCDHRWSVRHLPRRLLVALLASAAAAAVAAVHSALVGLLAGAAVLALGLGTLRAGAPEDPGRRALLRAGLGAVGVLAAGAGVGHALARWLRPDPRPRLEAMARDLGAEYLELVVRAYHPERSGDLQLLVTPFSSSNYPQESRSLVPNDPRTSHAVVWMYAERVPIVVYAPGLVEPSDSTERVTLADLAPTTARLAGFDGFRAPDGRALPGITAPARPPRVIVTFVIDGGGWNVLRRWPDAWPNLRRLARAGALYRNAITGSFPAVTASAHATIGTGAFPRTHGITGHNVRRDGRPRKAWGEPGRIDPSFLLVPTLADAWTAATGNEAWVGEIGYQVWHVGMLGRGGRPRGELPVGVFWDEEGGGGWKPHNPELYRLPRAVPPAGRLEQLRAAFDGFPPSPFDPQGRKAVCCSPPIVRYQAELVEATLASERVGDDEVTDLLYVNYKAPDYAGHVYNMEDPRIGEVLAAVDRELGRLADLLEAAFGRGGFALIVTADHGQCPLIDPAGGVRIDPIQLQEDLERRFGRSLLGLVEAVAPSEIYLDRAALWDAGLSAEDLAAFLADYRYGDNIGPYVRPEAIRRDRLSHRSFAAVLPTSFIAELARRDLSRYGATRYVEADPDGIPSL